MEAGGGLAAKRDLRSVNAEDAGIASRSAERGGDAAAGEEAELHEPERDVVGEVDPVEDRFLPLSEIEEGRGGAGVRHVGGRRAVKLDLSHRVGCLRRAEPSSEGGAGGPAPPLGTAYFAPGAAGPLTTSRSSTSKTSVAPGLICGGEPASP